MKHFIFPRDAVAEAQRALRADDPQSHAFYLGQADGLAQARRGIPYDRKMATETDPFSRGYSVGYGVIVKREEVGKEERQSGSPQRTEAFAVRSKSGRVMRSKKPWQVSLMVISPERPGLKHQRQYQFSSEHSEKDARSKAIEEAEKSGLRVVEVVWIKQKYEYT